ncbi:MAG: hypothetical protein AB1443_09850 [Pseudomonadota bacterium]
MLTSTTRGYMGKGPLYIKKRGASEAPIAVGNCKTLSYKVDTERKARIDYQNAGGGELDVQERITAVGGEMTVDDFKPENIARALRGSVDTIAAAAVTNEAVTLFGGSKAFLAYIPDPAQSVVVTVATYPAWTNNHAYVVGEKIVEGTHLYVVTIAGTSSGVEPTWPTDGTTVADGSATWKDLGSTTLVEDTHYPLSADSVSVEYLVNAATRTLLDNSNGVLSGTGATGTVDYAKGKIVIEYSDRLPDAGSVVTVTATKLVSQDANPITRSFMSTCDANRLFDLADDPNFAAIHPGSLRGTITLTSSAGDILMAFVDNGAGGLETTGYNNGQITVAGGLAIGTINYNTGVVTATASVAITYLNWRPLYGFFIGQNPGTWEAKAGTAQAKIGATGSFVYQTTAGTNTSAVSVGVPVDGAGAVPPVIDLCRTTSQTVVPGSVLFALAGKTYWDENGTLYSRVNTTDLTKIASGAIDYGTGLASIGLWNDDTALGVVVSACLTAYGDFTALDADFRTAGSPLRPASFYVQVTAKDGELLTATSDQNGAITGNNIVGTINQTMGVAHLDFGAMVTAAGLENEWWYDAANVIGGLIWQPREVLPGTLRYNCVVQTSLPLDASLLGVDPVRLPMDGRVPIIRAGDIVVLHHTEATSLPNPVTLGQSYSLGRASLAAVTLEDQAGTFVDAANWTANLTAGTLTIAANANLAGLTQPLVARHRIEQMNLCTDSQITGQVALAFPLERAFPSGSLLSSALVFGDMVARVSNVFDQATWTSVWADALIGSQSNAQYDDVNYPIEVLNDGAVSERWRISFTGTTTFAVIGENLGQIATGTTAADVQVVNPLTGLAYFTLRAAGWGSGWATGNQLRFNTVGANAPVWVARVILAGAGLSGDALTLELRGDTD